MTTKLDRPLRREVEVDGTAYTLVLDDKGFKLVKKGHRHGHELSWKAVVTGDAAIAAGLQANAQRIGD